MPTQLPSTLDDYADRFNGLVRAARRHFAEATGGDEASVKLTPEKLVAFLIDRKSRYVPSSWRLVRRSVVWALEEIASRVEPAFAEEAMHAIARLRAETADRDGGSDMATSSTKAKGLPADDLSRISHAALATRAKCADGLARYLRVGVIAGLRPCEWQNAALSGSSLPANRWMLVVANAKSTNGRSHGEFRTLHWSDLPRGVVQDMRAWIEIAREPDYQRRLATMRHLMWHVTRDLWPRRAKWPTLYSTRHEAIAAWKAFYIRSDQNEAERREALATIAALAGHGSDETASSHYARANAASGEPSVAIPAADPAEVERVRAVMDLQWREILRKYEQENDM